MILFKAYKAVDNTQNIASTSLNEKIKIRITFQNRYSPSSCFLGYFRNCIINKRINVCICQTLNRPKPWCNDSGVLNLHHGYYTTIMTSRWLFRHNPVSRGTNQPIRKSEFVQCMKVE